MDNITRARNTTLGAMIMTAFAIGSYVTIPVFILPLIMKLGVGVGEITLVFTFAGIGGLVTSFLLGTLVKKIPVKVLVVSAGILLAGFFVILGTATNIVLIYIGAIVFGYTTTVGGFGIAQTAITWWNAANIGKKLSLVSVGVGIAGMIFPIVVGILLNKMSFQVISIGVGVVSGSIMILCGLFLISDHPSKYDLTAVGAEEASAQQANQAGASTKKSLSVKQIISTQYFWFIIISLFIMTLASTGFTNNAPTFYTTIGISETMAATLAGITSGVAILFSLLFGIMVDKFGPVKSITIYGVLIAIVFVGATFLSGVVGGAIIAVLLGLKTMTGMIGSMTLPRLFGRKEAASVIGYSMVSQNIGAMFGAPFAGFLFDAFGNYNTFFLTAAAMVVVAVIFINLGSGKKAYEKVDQLAA
ncbi:MFS transporter [Alkalibacter mobilis]|uniref:MFS transporter n=1 Tax=Alkalibacter mobilis TaxID=2787712 RepID=UPI00189D7F9C|nr:MFS transporter [Alkalibacter mobilis]MBF7096829.1 MFS transporter [Alkalibacter mobilis]